MKDLLALMKDERALLKMGIKMESDDEIVDNNEKYEEGCYTGAMSQFSRITATANGGRKYIH